ncbi:hypothetical protein BC936DRAFT_146282 [Jimgerdemannia flammicorona]|uniref:Concanavalin A-like lectin/glucanase domain-containing protein n=1 Tax=Jimgerdemannia flammicorona TaxID=994334 RepID=A0A433D7Z9_9FUNG|nr:hypothetical protein BC936DRAFT_146282 [Jimgerdemannia flammicorona]
MYSSFKKTRGNTGQSSVYVISGLVFGDILSVFPIYSWWINLTSILLLVVTSFVSNLPLPSHRDFPYLLGEDIQLEIIDTPTIFETGTRREISHADLPIVSEALSITLRFKLLSHSREYGRIFQKGIDGTNVRTPTLFLAPNTSQLHPCFSTTKDWNVHLFVGDSLVLGRTYHFTYAISATEGRLDVYINGVLAGFKCVTDIVTEQIVFNNEPLRMGNFESYASAKCEIV